MLTISQATTTTGRSAAKGFRCIQSKSTLTTDFSLTAETIEILKKVVLP